MSLFSLEKKKMLLEVASLTKEYGGKKVVDNLSFSVNEGEVVGLLGPNGAGKTTAFYITIGLISPTTGNVFFSRRDVTKLPIHKRARMGMGYLAQEPSVFRQMSVEDNIVSILEFTTLSKKERLQKLEDLLEELSLTRHRKKIACTLSGGERRRLEITRALVTNPTLLLLDEPFANIDPLSVKDVKTLITHLKKKGISVLITDHNARELVSIVDRCYLINEGKVLLEGTPRELVENEHARRTYFGEDFKL